jgi:hypothetical protein
MLNAASEGDAFISFFYLVGRDRHDQIVALLICGEAFQQAYGKIVELRQ